MPHMDARECTLACANTRTADEVLMGGGGADFISSPL